MTAANVVNIWRETPYVLRYVPTCLKPSNDGLRGLMRPAQGHLTFDTPAEAQRWIALCIDANPASTLERLYGPIWKLAVCEVECYPVHHDPKRVYFDESEVMEWTS